MDIAGVYDAQGFKSYLEESGICYEAAIVEGLEGTHCYCDEGAEEAILSALGQGSMGTERQGTTATDRQEPMGTERQGTIATECDGAVLTGIRGAVATGCAAPERTCETGTPIVRFIGSGDYHYITCLLAQDIREPFSLVLLDHHPDNQAPALGDVLSCGGWVSELRRRNKYLEEVLTIGPEGCPQSIPEGWLEQRKGKNVYVSLDKDIMGPQYAVTGWSQGKHTLEDVKGMIRQIIDSEVNTIAVDVCGETAPENCQAVNLEANVEILKTIINTLK